MKRLLFALCALLSAPAWAVPPGSAAITTPYIPATGGGVAATIKTTAISPLLDLDLVAQKSYAGAAVPAALAVSRAGLATVEDSIGQPRMAMPNTPRFTTDAIDFLPAGLLVEEASQNGADSTYGDTASVGTVGSGGALPTGWNNLQSTSSNGVSVQLVSKPNSFDGTMVLRFFGTPTATGTFYQHFNSSTSFAAVSGDVVTMRYKLQVSAGTSPSTLTADMQERNSSGNYLALQGSSFIPQTDTLFAAEKTFTMGNASAAYAMFGFGFSITSGTPIDFTVSLREIQIEKKAFPTSYVANDATANLSGGGNLGIVDPNTGTLNGTRAADDVSVASASTYLSGGAWSALVAARASKANLANATLWQADDGTTANRITLRTANSVLYLTAAIGGVASDVRLGVWIPMTSGRVALSYSSGALRVSYNGKPAVSATGPSAALARILLGSGAAGYWNATIGRIAQFRGALSDADLVQIATPVGLFDDFDRANGAIGVPPTGQTYRQIPQAYSATVRQHYITGGKAVTDDSGTGVKTNAYTAVDLGQTPRIMAMALTFASGSGGTPTLISQPNGPDTIAQIVTQSVHLGFNQAGAYFGTFLANTLTQELSFAYRTNAVADGTTPNYLVAQFAGNAIVIRDPGGALFRFADTRFSSFAGRYCTFETYFTAGQNNHSFTAVRFETAP